MHTHHQPPPPQPSPISGSSHQPHSSQNPKVSSRPHPNQQGVRSVLSPARPPPASSPPRPSLPSLLPPHCPEPILNALFTPCSGRLVAPGTRRRKSRLQTDSKTLSSLLWSQGPALSHTVPQPVTQDLAPGPAEGAGAPSRTCRAGPRLEPGAGVSCSGTFFSSPKCASASFSVLILVSPPTKEGPSPHTWSFTCPWPSSFSAAVAATWDQMSPPP